MGRCQLCIKVGKKKAPLKRALEFLRMSFLKSARKLSHGELKKNNNNPPVASGQNNSSISV